MTLEVRSVGYSYTGERNAVEEVSFALGSGEIVCVLGKNGSGKSTLFSCIGGTARPDSGAVLVDGVDLWSINPRERAQMIGTVAQRVDPGFSFTAFESVLLGRTPHLSAMAGPSANDHEIAEEALGSVGLLHLAERPVREMSGGEQQLVRIARGLCQRAPILLLDEPGAHLDPANRERVLEVVTQLALRGTAFLFSSHDPNDALGYADRAVVLREGRLLADGPPREVLTPETIAAALGVRTIRTGQGGDLALVPIRPPAVEPESIGRPDGFLRRIYREGDAAGSLVVVSGLRQTGKTRWCRALVDQARHQGIAVAGLLAPAVFDGRHKSAIDQLDLRTGETRRLANRQRAFRGRWAFGNDNPRAAWSFDDEVIAWGNAILEAELERATELLVIDEIGPLELVHQEGLSAALSILDARTYRLAVVVVRSSLVARALERWPWAIPIHTDQRYRIDEL